MIQKRKNSKTKKILLAVLLGVIALGAVGFGVYQAFNEETPVVETDNSGVSESIVSRGVKIRLLSTRTLENNAVEKTFSYSVEPSNATNKDVKVTSAYVDGSDSSAVITTSVDTSTQTITVVCNGAFKQKIIIIVNIKTGTHVEQNYLEALNTIEEIKNLLKKSPNLKEEKIKIIEKPKSIDDEKEYEEKLSKIKKHIYDGDIFQAVFSRRFKGKMEGSLFEAYRNLRSINPSPYMYYMTFDDGLEVAGASPETLCSKENNLVMTYPIAGTRPRGKTALEDEMLEKELLKDKKELAEHNMLVDLGRNDIGRVSKFGSVKVLEYMKILRFSHVMHIASTVVGEIKDNKTSVDALESILPAGTLSGAPKLRACQIIDSLEKERRGIYGGALGYIDFTDNMNMCIVIRTIIKKNEDVYLQAGGGIVMDSDSKAEYLETENKAMATFKTLEAIGGK